MKVKIKTPKYNTGFYAVLMPSELKMRLTELKTFHDIDVPEEIRRLILNWVNQVENEINGGKHV